VIIIFLFLGSIRSAFIPVAAFPLSLIRAVFLMQALGLTINLLTLPAIVVSAGLVIDYTGESRQRRTEGSRLIAASGLAVVSLLLVLTAPFNGQGIRNYV
jgi:hypothetical protein